MIGEAAASIGPLTLTVELADTKNATPAQLPARLYHTTCRMLDDEEGAPLAVLLVLSEYLGVCLGSIGASVSHAEPCPSAMAPSHTATCPRVVIFVCRKRCPV